MRLGKDAMFRQQDMAFADALDVPAGAAHARVLDRGHPGGRARRSSRSASRCGPAGERASRSCAAARRTAPAGGARGAEALGAVALERLGVAAR